MGSVRSSELWQAFLFVRRRLIQAWNAEGMDGGEITARLVMDYEQVCSIASYDSGATPGELDREADALERELEHVEEELDEVRRRASAEPSPPGRCRPVVVPGVDLTAMSDDERDRAMAGWLFGSEPPGGKVS